MISKLNFTERVCLKTTGHRRTPQDTAGHTAGNRRTPQDTAGHTTGHRNEIKHYYKIKNRTSADKDIKISYE